MALHHFASRTAFVAALLVLSACTAVRAVPSATEADFAAIRPGMTRDQVLARFGPPAWSFGVRQENLTIMNYRYSYGSCTIYQVSVRPDGTVKDASPAWDPACDQP
jgi:hypothetical protein